MASTWFDSITNRRAASEFKFTMEEEENAAQPNFPLLATLVPLTVTELGP